MELLAQVRVDRGQVNEGTNQATEHTTISPSEWPRSKAAALGDAVLVSPTVTTFSDG